MAKREIAGSRFDYAICSRDEKSKLIWLAAEVGRLKEKGAELLIETGKVLAAAQEKLARHKSGTFIAWVEDECGLSKTTAYRSIQAYQVFGAYCPKLGQYDLSAIYELAAENTPSEAVIESIKLADSGKKITLDLAKSIIRKHAADPPPARPQTRISAAAASAPAGVAASPPAPSVAEECEPPPFVEAPAAADPDSLPAVQADLREYERRLRELARFGRQILGAEGNEITRPWCGCYSLLTLIHPLQHVARTVLNDLPVGGEPDNPTLYREQAAEEAG